MAGGQTRCRRGGSPRRLPRDTGPAYSCRTAPAVAEPRAATNQHLNLDALPTVTQQKKFPTIPPGPPAARRSVGPPGGLFEPHLAPKAWWVGRGPDGPAPPEHCNNPLLPCRHGLRLRFTAPAPAGGDAGLRLGPEPGSPGSGSSWGRAVPAVIPFVYSVSSR